MNFNQLINEIRKLNPGVEIRVGDPEFDSLADSRIFSSKPMQQLRLPQGFYANDKNGITNKHNTESGLYTSLSVESLSDMVIGQTYPSVDVSKSLETTDVREIAIAIQKLNPGVEIRLANPSLDPQADSKIFCSVPMSELALPVPFYANEKNGITNKHNSASGMYAAIDVEDLSKANPAILVSTGYNLQEEKRKQYDIDLQREQQEHLKNLDYRNELNQYYKEQLHKRVMDILQQYPALPITMPREIREEHRLTLEMMNLLDIGIKSAISKPVMTEDGLVIDLSTKERFEKCNTALAEIQRQNGVSIDKHPTPEKEQQNSQSNQFENGLQKFSELPKQEEPIEQMARMEKENRKFSILQRERAMNDAQKAKNRSAILAGICILGAAAAVYFNGQDMSQVLQHELNAIYSWEALGQYIRDLGPMTTLLAAGAGGFIAKYFKNSKKLKQAQNEFVDFNASLENANVNDLGGNENAKSR